MTTTTIATTENTVDVTNLSDEALDAMLAAAAAGADFESAVAAAQAVEDEVFVSALSAGTENEVMDQLRRPEVAAVVGRYRDRSHGLVPDWSVRQHVAAQPDFYPAWDEEE